MTSLVYEKQERLRIIMKMHGLGIGPYWMISYAYFLTLSMFYVISLVIFGSAIGLRYFRLNDYSVQFIFYFIFVNLQISFAFLASSIFSKVKTVTGIPHFLNIPLLKNMSELKFEWISLFYGLINIVVIAYILVYGTGLLGSFLFQKMIETQSFPGNLVNNLTNKQKSKMLMFIYYTMYVRLQKNGFLPWSCIPAFLYTAGCMSSRNMHPEETG